MPYSTLTGENSLLNWRNLIRGRLDILVRKAMVLEHLSGGFSKQSLDVYRRMIFARNGGIEGSKRGVDDFVESFRYLIDSILQDGFNSESPVLISSETGNLADGAHRLAVASALSIKPAVAYTSAAGGKWWGASWFVENGFTKDDMDYLTSLVFNEFRQELSVALVWGPLPKPAVVIREEIQEQAITFFSCSISRDFLKSLLKDLRSTKLFRPGMELSQTNFGFAQRPDVDVLLFVSFAKPSIPTGGFRHRWTFMGREPFGLEVGVAPEVAEHFRLLLFTDIRPEPPWVL